MRPLPEPLEPRDMAALVAVVDSQAVLPPDEVRRVVAAVHAPRDRFVVVTDPAQVPRGARRIYLEQGHADDLFVGQQTLTRSPFKVGAQTAYDGTLAGKNRTHPVGFISTSGCLAQGGPGWFARVLGRVWRWMAADPFRHRVNPRDTRGVVAQSYVE